jgi:hypothetical protein
MLTPAAITRDGVTAMPVPRDLAATMHARRRGVGQAIARVAREMASPGRAASVRERAPLGVGDIRAADHSW